MTFTRPYNKQQAKEEQYKLSQKIIEKAKVNIVTCGNCGSVVLHDVSARDIECHDCGFRSEPCDFPDLFLKE